MGEVDDHPVEYAQQIDALLAGVCYPVAKSALQIASVLIEHRFNVQRSSVLQAGLQAVGFQNVEMQPVHTE